MCGYYLSFNKQVFGKCGNVRVFGNDKDIKITFTKMLAEN